MEVNLMIDVPNPTFSEWSDKLHEVEEIVRKVKADIYTVSRCPSFVGALLLEWSEMLSQGRTEQKKKGRFCISSDSDSSYT